MIFLICAWDFSVLVATFDLEGFTPFFNQHDAHLSDKTAEMPAERRLFGHSLFDGSAYPMRLGKSGPRPAPSALPNAGSIAHIFGVATT